MKTWILGNCIKSNYQNSKIRVKRLRNIRIILAIIAMLLFIVCSSYAYINYESNNVIVRFDVEYTNNRVIINSIDSNNNKKFYKYVDININVMTLEDELQNLNKMYQNKNVDELKGID